MFSLSECENVGHCPTCRDITSVTTHPANHIFLSIHSFNSFKLAYLNVIWCQNFLHLYDWECLPYEFEFVIDEARMKIKKLEKKEQTTKYFPLVVMNKLTDQYPECDMPPVTMTPVSRVTRDMTLPPLSSFVIAHILHSDETRHGNITPGLGYITRGHRLVTTVHCISRGLLRIKSL